MSKPSSRPGAAASKDGDICPVCKSSRYLNPNMKFLVNPECYHKMCESCVDRIFSHGPAPCPIAGCKYTLRKPRFRKQTFEDLKVEREVDIRRRVASILNKQESDFTGLKAYNDYLETVEETTWNLILGVDVDATNKRLKLWEDAQRAERHSSVNRPSALQGDPSAPSESAHVVLKKGNLQRKVQTAGNAKTKTTAKTDSSNGTPEPAAHEAGAGRTDAAKKPDTGFSFAGLKAYTGPPKAKPFDPYGGYDFAFQYYTLQPDYTVEWLAKPKVDPENIGGGWDIADWYGCAMFDAFSGLGVFIGDEVAEKERLEHVSGDGEIGTRRAADAAMVPTGDVIMDDVF
ncbi:CDK-activating kinase assembly factor [Lophiostoma macrostomum CBS 122681]|uniref:RNA polymerase II transcription factor B subunit 3 n=1 Tax=Lophiostoma macrostomum CBS 122681 TaxID=1314788 RepID=A0A6A6SML5_9PLEO|nr:CDK-activating kinase assembly factor [Lophiostoma macrostomum CBS 122681]